MYHVEGQSQLARTSNDGGGGCWAVATYSRYIPQLTTVHQPYHLYTTYVIFIQYRDKNRLHVVQISVRTDSSQWRIDFPSST